VEATCRAVFIHQSKNVRSHAEQYRACEAARRCVTSASDHWHSRSIDEQSA